MLRYGFKLAVPAILLLLAGVAAIVIFGNVWVRVGIGAAMVIVFGGLLLFAWSHERKEKAQRAGLEELPRV